VGQVEAGQQELERLGPGRVCLARRPRHRDAQRRHHQPVRPRLWDAFNEWLTYNRFDIGPSHRAKLLVVMGLLPEIEAWRVTLKPLQRARMNHPGAVLLNYRRATGVKPPLEHVSPPAPA